MAQDPDLSKPQTYEVQLYEAELGDLGSGTLEFGASRWPTVTLGLAYSRKLVEGQRLALVKATTSNGEIFSLFDCTFNGFGISVDYVIAGECAAATFQRIEIRFSEVSEWFLASQRIAGTIGETLSWVNSSKPLSVLIDADGKRFTIDSQYRTSFEQRGEDHFLHEHVVFAVEVNEGQFVLVDLKKRAYELSCLFSLLLACPISLISIHVADDVRGAHWVYYPGVGKVDQPRSDDFAPHRCLIQKTRLDERWQAVFDRYYQSRYRQVIWVRLSGMLYYKGFWEYRLLGYVSLLDQYTERFNNSLDASAKVASNKGYLSRIHAAAKAIEPPMTPVELEEFGAGMRRLSKLVTERESFHARYALTVRQVDPVILKIIGIAEDDFEFVKGIRDRIAHGDDPSVAGPDYSRPETIVNKIALLLTYFAFTNIGLEKDDFLLCLERSQSKLCLSARIDAVQLDRATAPERFFSIGADALAALKQLPKITFHPCFTMKETGELAFAAELTEKYRSILFDRAIRTFPPDTETFGVPAEQIRYLGTAYLESESDLLKLHGVRIIEESGDCKQHLGWFRTAD